MKNNSLRAFCFLTTAFISATVHAAVPTSADPGQVQKRFEPAIPAPTVVRPAVAPTQVPAAARMQADPLSGKRVKLQNVVVEGNTVFADSQLKSAYAGMIGREISGKDARAIAKRVADYYRSHDYILAQATVPNQTGAGGTLKIRVNEGSIGSVSFVGDIKGDRGLLEAYGRNITSSRPLKGSELERNMLLMDDLPGATAKALIRPSSTPGVADLIVTMTQKDYDFSYSADNRGSKPIGPFQHSLMASANSLFGLYDRTTVRAIAASPVSELMFFDLQHEEQLGSHGTKIIGTVSHSRTDPGDNLRALNVIGTSDFAQLNVSHPFMRGRGENLSGRIIFDARNTDTDLAGANFTEDRLRVVRLGGNYNFVDPWMGASLIDAEISQGLNIFNASSSGSARTRANGDSDFTKVNLDLSRTQNISGPWSFLTAASAQYSSSPLLAAEQFLLGGPGYGRAYDPSELTGDHGLAGKAELRYNGNAGYEYLSAYQLYGFYDIGKVWYKTPVSGSADEKSLSSLGAGVRLYFSPMLYGNIEGAIPLTKEASNQGNHGDDARLFFSITATY